LAKRRVIAFGSFDILHPGHLHYLRQASTFGSLVVIVARDKSIEKLKGHKPLMDENSRLEVIKSLRFVNLAVLGDKIRKWNDIYKILIKFKPDIIALGYDQKVDMVYLKKFLDDNGLHSKIVRVKPFNGAQLKSSKIKKLMARY
jgi:FAD synthetase